LRDESGHAGLRFPPAPGRLSARRSGGSITYISLRSWSRPPRAHRPRPRPPSADEHLPTVDGRTGAPPAGRPRGPGCRGLSRRGRPGAAPLRSRNQRPLRCPRRANALTPAERERVPAALNSAEFIDTTPVQVYATMFDRGMYLCSVSSMYRILAVNAQAKGRRRLARQPARGCPRANHGRGSAPGTPGNVCGNPWSATSTADLVSTPRRHLT